MTKKLTDYAALTFDCYGTLIDWESGIWDALQPLLMANREDGVSRDAALRLFAEVESAQQAATPGRVYPEILRHVHITMAERLNLVTTEEMDVTFGASVPHWPAFPDSADALRMLQHHFKLVILSNVHRDGFAGSNRKLGVHFDAVYTAQDIGSYKPAPANFDHMLTHLKNDLNVAPGDILHTAQSLFHDHVPATKAGLATAWIDRQRLADGGSTGATAEVAERPEVDFRFLTMGAMAQAVAAEN